LGERKKGDIFALTAFEGHRELGWEAKNSGVRVFILRGGGLMAGDERGFSAQIQLPQGLRRGDKPGSLTDKGEDSRTELQKERR